MAGAAPVLDAAVLDAAVLDAPALDAAVPEADVDAGGAAEVEPAAVREAAGGVVPADFGVPALQLAVSTVASSAVASTAASPMVLAIVWLPQLAGPPIKAASKVLITAAMSAVP
jgi:hypothetical protein